MGTYATARAAHASLTNSPQEGKASVVDELVAVQKPPSPAPIEQTTPPRVNVRSDPTLQRKEVKPMRRATTIAAGFGLLASLAAISFAAEAKSGLQVGESLPKFVVVDATGEYKQDPGVCYI